MNRRKIAQRLYDPDDQAQPAPAAAAPAEQQAAAAPAAVAQTAEHVADATESANEAAQRTGEDGWKVVAGKLDTLSADIRSLAEKLPAAQPAPPAPTKPDKPAAAAAATPAAVTVKPPEKQVRKVFRNGRWVTREGKA